MTRDQLKRRIQDLARQVYSATTVTPEEAIEYDELTKFPELKKVIVDLLTLEYDNFLASIDWVAPRPSTFRINLKNDQNFYLIYGERSWIAQVEGKKYYLLNLPEEERATQSIANMLRYGVKEEEGSSDLAITPEAPPAETPPSRRTTSRRTSNIIKTIIMKNEQLKKLIKEEIKSILKEEAPAKESTEVKKLTDYLEGMGKTALAQINSPTELDSVLTAIFSGMNDSFKTNAKAVAIQKVIAMKLG
jgi:hypothetical protein